MYPIEQLVSHGMDTQSIIDPPLIKLYREDSAPSFRLQYERFSEGELCKPSEIWLTLASNIVVGKR